MILPEMIVAMMRALPGAALLVSRDGRIGFANAGARTALALASEHPERALTDLVTPATREGLAKYLARCSSSPTELLIDLAAPSEDAVTYVCRGTVISEETAASPALILLYVEPHGAPSELPHPASPARSTPSRTDLAGLRILIVDDDRDAVEMLGALLEGFGAEVVTCNSAAEAFGKTQAILPDLLISDIGMPTEDGYSLIERVRLLPEKAGGATLAIALTAFARAQDRTKALTSGFQAHVAKPVEIMQLVSLIVRVTGPAPAPAP